MASHLVWIIRRGSDLWNKCHTEQQCPWEMSVTAWWGHCCFSVVLSWSHGHGQQQDRVSSVLLSLQHHTVLLSPCSCVSPQVLRYVADQWETFCLRCAWNCLKGLEGHCHVHRWKAGDLGEESPVRNEMALLCPKHSDCAIRGSDCKLVFDGLVYGQLTLSPRWHTCKSMWETHSRSTVSNQAKISVKRSLFISAIMGTYPLLTREKLHK